jgi:hypothetical protein
MRVLLFLLLASACAAVAAGGAAPSPSSSPATLKLVQQPIAEQKHHEPKLGVDVVAPVPITTSKHPLPPQSAVKLEAAVIPAEPIAPTKHHKAVKLAVPVVAAAPISEQKHPSLSLPTAPLIALTCPVVQFTPKLSCSESSCAVHFLSLTPSQPLDWVDVHVKSSAAGMLAAIGADAAALKHPAIHMRMGLAAGPKGMHHASMGMEEGSSNFHSSLLGLSPSAATALLHSSGASQIFSAQLPVKFAHGDRISVSFTYCASGTDCNTAAHHFQLREEKLTYAPLTGSKKLSVPTVIAQPITEQKHSHSQQLLSVDLPEDDFSTQGGQQQSALGLAPSYPLTQNYQLTMPLMEQQQQQQQQQYSPVPLPVQSPIAPLPLQYSTLPVSAPALSKQVSYSAPTFTSTQPIVQAINSAPLQLADQSYTAAPIVQPTFQMAPVQRVQPITATAPAIRKGYGTSTNLGAWTGY